MKNLTIVFVAAASLLSASAVVSGQGRTPGQQQATANTAQEIYHVHFVKAAPGKLRDIIDAYANGPVDPASPGQPIVLRHLEGDDWDLVVLTPLGKETTLRVSPASPEDQQFIQRSRALRAEHADTFTLGPPWSEARAALVGDSTRAVGTAGTVVSGPVYTVTVYRAVTGHRDQLGQVLQRIAATDAGRTVTLQHMEGAPWDFVLITRYDSWSALGDSNFAPSQSEMERMKSQGFNTPEAVSMELREHMAEHRDTIAVRVNTAPKPVR